MGGRAWTAFERKRVVFWWCVVDIGYIAKQLHRSPKAVEHVARQMGLRTTRYTETLQRFSDRTGYTDKQVLKAVRALGMNLHRQARVSVPAKGLAQKRHTKGGRAAARAITEEQGERIVQWLREQTAHCWRLQSGGKVRDGVWGVGHKPKACIVCGTTDHPHEAKGKCQRCYDRDRQSTPEAKARAKARQRERRKWRKAGNPGVPPRFAPAARPALPPVAPWRARKACQAAPVEPHRPTPLCPPGDGQRLTPIPGHNCRHHNARCGNGGPLCCSSLLTNISITATSSSIAIAHSPALTR